MDRSKRRLPLLAACLALPAFAVVGGALWVTGDWSVAGIAALPWTLLLAAQAARVQLGAKRTAAARISEPSSTRVPGEREQAEANQQSSEQAEQDELLGLALTTESVSWSEKSEPRFADGKTNPARPANMTVEHQRLLSMALASESIVFDEPVQGGQAD